MVMSCIASISIPKFGCNVIGGIFHSVPRTIHHLEVTLCCECICSAWVDDVTCISVQQPPWNAVCFTDDKVWSVDGEFSIPSYNIVTVHSRNLLDLNIEHIEQVHSEGRAVVIAIVVRIVDVRHAVTIGHFVRIVETISIIIKVFMVVNSVTIEVCSSRIPIIRNTVVVIIRIVRITNAVSVVVIGAIVALVIEHIFLWSIRNCKHSRWTTGAYVVRIISRIIQFIRYCRITEIHSIRLHQEQGYNQQSGFGSHVYLYVLRTNNLTPYVKSIVFHSQLQINIVE